jgi:hypothetical protein
VAWDPPPHGYNVDQPGNFFTFRDWDFTAFNATLGHYIDELKLNTLVLVHSNPLAANLFKHLPGKPLEEWCASPPHVTLAWQFFRECTFVAWGKRDGDPQGNRSIEISQQQFDRLLLDFYRAVAGNLEKRGWLDRVFIWIDETHDEPRLLHLLRLLKSDPLTARIRVAVCIQGLTYFNFKEQPGADRYAYHGLLDVYMPQIDENYHRFEDYFMTDYGLVPDRRNLFFYAVETTRMPIDTPGINNRVIGMDVFRRGGGGYFVWETLWWDHEYASARNPWDDPGTVWGNGMTAYFYPPRRTGPSPEPDYTLVPSLRMETYRESADDYEYALLLETLTREAEARGRDVSVAQALLGEIDRFFYNSVHWSQNDAWFLSLMQRIAHAIVDLNAALARKAG